MRIVIIGIGNVGLNLLDSFCNNGIIIEQVAGRNDFFLKSVARKYQVNYTADLDSLSVNADLYIISVNDESIKDVLKYIPRNKMVVHTSGSTDIKDLSGFRNYGVFYPLQTFSTEKLLNFKDIPICVEGNSKSTSVILDELAGCISTKIYRLNSEQRKYLHLAAIFACNFTNYMYLIAENMLDEKGIAADVIHPLIEETAKKFIGIGAKRAQTGPAKRNDQNIIKKHLDLLSSNPELKDLYQQISKNIQAHNDEEF